MAHVLLLGFARWWFEYLCVLMRWLWVWDKKWTICLSMLPTRNNRFLFTIDSKFTRYRKQNPVDVLDCGCWHLRSYLLYIYVHIPLQVCNEEVGRRSHLVIIRSWKWIKQDSKKYRDWIIKMILINEKMQL